MAFETGRYFIYVIHAFINSRQSYYCWRYSKGFRRVRSLTHMSITSLEDTLFFSVRRDSSPLVASLYRDGERPWYFPMSPHMTTKNHRPRDPVLRIPIRWVKFIYIYRVSLVYWMMSAVAVANVVVLLTASVRVFRLLFFSDRLVLLSKFNSARVYKPPFRVCTDSYVHLLSI